MFIVANVVLGIIISLVISVVISKSWDKEPGIVCGIVFLLIYSLTTITGVNAGMFEVINNLIAAGITTTFVFFAMIFATSY